jgi:hypothetical protein
MTVDPTLIALAQVQAERDDLHVEVDRLRAKISDMRSEALRDKERNNVTKEPNMKKFHIGTSYVFSIPPSWLIGGTVTEIDGDHILISDAVYLESVNSGYSLIGSTALAKNAQELSSIVAASWPLSDGTILHVDGILMAVPAVSNFRSLARAADADLIKKTR